MRVFFTLLILTVACQAQIRNIPAATNLANDTKWVVDDATFGTRTITWQYLSNLISSGGQASIVGAASSITQTNLLTERLLISDNAGKVTQSAVTSTEAGYLAGSTNSLQPQLDARAVQVATLADLISLDAAGVRLASTAGYHTQGDGGAGLYRWTNSLPSGVSTNRGAWFAGSTGFWNLVQDPPVSLLQWGVIRDDPTQGALNATKIRDAMRYYETGGHLILPASSLTTYVGPNPVRPARTLRDLTVEINGNIKVPDSPTWTADNPALFLLVQDGDASRSYNNIRFFGTGTIDGNAMNQASTGDQQWGKQCCFRIQNATNVVISGLTVKSFGSIALLFRAFDNIHVRDMTIIQNTGNNDSNGARWGTNMDGIHFFDGINGSATGNTIDSTDDCIAVGPFLAGGVNNQFVIANNLLRPQAGTTNILPNGVRVLIENDTADSVSNVLVEGNVILCHGAQGVHVGTLASSTGNRGADRVVIKGNLINEAALAATVAIGPNAGQSITVDQLSRGAINVFKARTVVVDGNSIFNTGGAALIAAGVGSLRFTGNTISNVVDIGTNPRGSGVYIARGNIGPVDDILIDGNSFERLGTSAFYADGATFTGNRVVFTRNIVKDWFVSGVDTQTINRPAFFGFLARTNIVSDNTFLAGRSTTVNIKMLEDGVAEVSGNDMHGMGFADTNEMYNYVRIENTNAPTGRVRIAGNNMRDAGRTRVVLAENIASLEINDNDVGWMSLEGVTSQGEVIRVNYTEDAGGEATLQIVNNRLSMADTTGVTRFISITDNGESGGSNTDVFSTIHGNIVGQNLSGGDVRVVVDGISGGSKLLPFDTSVAVPFTGVAPYVSRINAEGDFTLTFATPIFAEWGSVIVKAPATNVIVTLPSGVYSPTGATVEVPAGADKFTVLKWHADRVAGERFITVTPVNVDR